MIATQSPPWTEQGDRLREAVAHVARAADAVAGPLPRRLGTPSRQPALAAGRLAVQGALWGVVLGLLAPATTILVQVSGLAAPGVQLVGSTDLGFFFGFVPLLTALVVTLLALDHWPLDDLRAYHRELTVGLLLVGTVTLVGLRAHGAAVTGDSWDDAWLFANGSLVLHVLVTWCLVRLATNDLTALHARRAGWRGPRTPATGLARPDPDGAARRPVAGTPPASLRRPETTATTRPGSGRTPGRRAADARQTPASTTHTPVTETAAKRDVYGWSEPGPATMAGTPQARTTAGHQGTTRPVPARTASGRRPAGAVTGRSGPEPAEAGSHTADPAPGGQRFAGRTRPGPAAADRSQASSAAGSGTGPKPGDARVVELAWDGPRHLATLALAFRSIVWGVIVGTAAGAAAGTAVQPGPGTLAGGYLGAIYGLVPTAIGTAAVVTVVSWRRDTDPVAAEWAVRATLAAVGAGVLAAAWPFLQAAQVPGSTSTELAGDPQRAWLLGAVVVVLLLRRAAPQLAATYVRLIPRAVPG